MLNDNYDLSELSDFASDNPVTATDILFENIGLPPQDDAKATLERVLANIIKNGTKTEPELDDDVMYALISVGLADPISYKDFCRELKRAAEHKGDFDQLIKSVNKVIKAKQKELEAAKTAYYQAINSGYANVIDAGGLHLESGKYYAKTSGGIYYDVVSEQGVKTHTVIEQLIIITKIIRNIDNGTCKACIGYESQDEGKQWREVTVPLTMISQTNKITELSQYGILINSNNAAGVMDYLNVLSTLNATSGNLPTVNGVNRLGWSDDKYNIFLPYDSGGGIEYDGEAEYMTFYKAVQQRGSLDNWIGAIQPYHKSNPIVAISLAASFASILLEPLKCQLFTLCLWGGTGTGKTVLLQTLASMWGEPAAQNGLISSLNSTEVGLERKYAFFGSLPVLLDELQTVRNSYIDGFDDIAYKHEQGKGRTRGTAKGGIDIIPTWRNIQIVTGEEPLIKTNSGGGAANRVLEIQVTDNIFPRDKICDLLNTLDRNYGLCGTELIKITKELDFDQLRADINAYTAELEKQLQTTGKQARNAAVIMVADRILCEHIFTASLPLDVENFRDFVKTAVEVDIGERAYNDIIAWIAENIVHFESAAKNEQDRAREPRALECYGKINEREHYIAITSTKLREILKDDYGYDVSAVTQQWAKTGKLLCRDPKRLQCVDKISGIPNRTYRIKHNF